MISLIFSRGTLSGRNDGPLLKCAIAALVVMVSSLLASAQETAITAQPIPGITIKGNAGVFVGVNLFTDKTLNHLDYAVNDAIGLAHAFVLELHLIPSENCWLLISGDPVGPEAETQLKELQGAGIQVKSAIRAEVLNALNQAATVSGSEQDLIAVSVSSHGFEERGVPYWLPSDCLRNILEDSGIPCVTFEKRLKTAKAHKRIIFIDACRENATSGSRDLGGAMSQAFKTTFENSEGEVVFSSCSVGQFSSEAPELKHGVFSYYLLKALKGDAPSQNQEITLGSIADYVSTQVYHWAKFNRGSLDDKDQQRPWFDGANDARMIPLAVTIDFISQQERKKDGWTNLVSAMSVDNSEMPPNALIDVKKALRVFQGDKLEILLQQLALLKPNTPFARENFARYWNEVGQQVKPLEIVSNICDVSVPLNGTATFTIDAKGPSIIEYNWQFQLDGKGPWTVVEAPNSAVLKLEHVGSSQVGLYRAVLKANGETNTGQPARLNLVARPLITSNPESQTAEENQSVTFAVVATGDGLNFNWQYKPVHGNSWANLDTTAPTFTLNKIRIKDAGSYRVKVTNASGEVTSQAATLEVTPAITPPHIVSEPENVDVEEGELASFSVESKGTEPLHYTWQLLKNGSGWHDVGHDDRTLSLSSLRESDSGRIRVKVINSAGSETSDSAELKVRRKVVSFTLFMTPGVQYTVEGINIFGEGGAFLTKTIVGTKIPPPINSVYLWQIQWVPQLAWGFSQVKADGSIIDLVPGQWGFLERPKGRLD